MPALLAVLLLLTSVGACAAPRSITGTVKRVFDGDSLVVSASGRAIEVRLGEIDTPEHGQPYADISRKALQGMLLGKRACGRCPRRSARRRGSGAASIRRSARE